MRYLTIFALILGAALTPLSGAVYGPEDADQHEHRYHHTKRGNWLTRVRALYILPNDSSGSWNRIPHAGVCVHPAWTGEFDFGYMFTKNLGSEFAITTSEHTLKGKGSLSGKTLGTTWILPPTFTLHWRFFPTSIAQPYVGGGVNFTLFYNQHSAIKNTQLQLQHTSWGPVLQAGIDLFFYKDWFFNLDTRYVWMSSRVHLAGTMRGHVDVTWNPWFFGFGVGKKW